jgi:intracellular multiplication protein IcmK
MRRIVIAMTPYILAGASLILSSASFADDNNMANANSLQQQLQFMQQMQPNPTDPNALQPNAQAPRINPATQSPPVQTPTPLQQRAESTSVPTQQMVQAAPTIQASSNSIEQSAFNGLAKQLLPLSPAQIHKLRQLYDQAQYAAAADPGTPPTPSATSRFVSLAPGATPPVIRLASGFITSVVFLDSTGAPWPIESYDLGNPSAFDIQWNRKDNILMIQAKSYYTYGNLAVRLSGKEANTPVMLTLIPGQQSVDYRIDLRIQGLGPNATAPTIEGLPGQANPELLNVLDGVPPANSQHLSVSGGDADAWLAGEKLFIRTRLTILSPSWIATMASADGTKAYEMQRTPLILVSSQGKVLQLKIEGF